MCLPPGTAPDVEEAPAPGSHQACAAPKQFFPSTSVSVSDAALYPEGVLHHQSQEEVFFTQDGEMPATFDIKNIYLLPDQGEQTTMAGHFELRSPPGQELLVNDRAVIRAEGPSAVKAESSLRARPTAPLTPPAPSRDCYVELTGHL